MRVDVSVSYDNDKFGWKWPVILDKKRVATKVAIGASKTIAYQTTGTRKRTIEFRSARVPSFPSNIAVVASAAIAGPNSDTL